MEIIFSGYGKVKQPNLKPTYYPEVLVVGEGGAPLHRRPYRLYQKYTTASAAMEAAQTYVKEVNAAFIDHRDVQCGCGALLEFKVCENCDGEGYRKSDDPKRKKDLAECSACHGLGSRWICPRCFKEDSQEVR